MYRIGNEEIEAVARVIRSGALFKINGGAQEVRHFEDELCEKFGTTNAICMTSGKAALISALIGMGGALDSSRFKCYLAKATGANINNVDGMVIGGHGDTTMIPLVSKATVNGVPVSQFASKKKLEEAVANTMVGGATLTKLIGTSAWYAPGAGAAMMVEAILNDQKKMVPCCCYLDGEYGQKDICIGVPAIIGRKGIEKIVKIDLTKEEAEKFAASAEAVRKTNNILHEIKAL